MWAPCKFIVSLIVTANLNKINVIFSPLHVLAMRLKEIKKFIWVRKLEGIHVGLSSRLI